MRKKLESAIVNDLNRLTNRLREASELALSDQWRVCSRCVPVIILYIKAVVSPTQLLLTIDQKGGVNRVDDSAK